MIGDGYRVTTGSSTLPDGQWLVVNRDGQRWEFPIAPAPELRDFAAEVAALIGGLDADQLWDDALSTADMTVSPAEALLRGIIRSLTG